MSSSLKTIKALIIHLDRADERQIQVELPERLLPCPAMELRAVDNLDLDDKTIFHFFRKKLYRFFILSHCQKTKLHVFCRIDVPHKKLSTMAWTRDLSLKAMLHWESDLRKFSGLPLLTVIATVLSVFLFAGTKPVR